MDVKNLSHNCKQVMAKSVLIAAALLVCSLVPTGAQAILAISEPAPSFSLVSGDIKSSRSTCSGERLSSCFMQPEIPSRLTMPYHISGCALRGSTAKYSESNL